jgi:hypothetical protein
MEKIREGRVRCIIGDRTEIIEGIVEIDNMWHGGGKVKINEISSWCLGFCTILEYIEELNIKNNG